MAQDFEKSEKAKPKKKPSVASRPKEGQIKDAIRDSIIMKMQDEKGAQNEPKATSSNVSWDLPIQLKTGKKTTAPNEVNIFIRKLSVLLSSGISLSRGLRVMIARTTDHSFKSVLATVLEDVEKGSQFWSALARHPKYFDNMTVNIIRTGEESGSLVKVMNYLSSYRDREVEMIRSVQRSVTYPLFLMLIAIGILIVLVTTIIPLFAQQFEAAKMPLPWPTRLVISLSDAASSFWLLFFLALGLGIFVYKRSDQLGGLKNFLDRAKLRLPIFGRILSDIYTVQFSSVMSILLRAGLPMPRTLELLRDTMPNILYKNAFQYVKDSIESGRTLQESFSNLDVIPSMAKDMIAVGEEAGTVPEVLDQLANIYQKEVDHNTIIIGQLLEPILIVGMGLVALFIAVSIFWPYVRMVSFIVPQ